MRPRGRTTLMGATAAILLAVVMAACSGATGVPQPVGQGGPNGGGVAAPQAPSEGAKGGDSTGAGGEQTGTDTGTSGGRVALVDDARIVRTGKMTLEVADLDAAVSSARTAIAGLGGYVAGSQVASDGDRTFASITYRIPVARWEEALAALRGLAGRVVAEETQSVEVTSQVLDLDARITNLRATEKALQEIMGQAARIEDILNVQRELTQVQGEIEQLSTQKAHLEDQADVSTLSVQFATPLAATAEVQQGWDPAAEVDQATAALIEMGQRIASAVIWFGIVILPVLVVLGLLAGIMLFAVRRLGRGRRGPTTGAPPLDGEPTAPASAA